MTTDTDRHRSDFDGDGFADILWRDHAGDNVLWLMNNSTPSDVVILPAVTPDWHVKATAQFDLSGRDEDILWQNDNGALALWKMGDGAAVRNISELPNPGPTWHVVGDNDFNNDGADDILFRNDNGSLALWTVTSATGTVSGMFAGTQDPGPTWHVVGTGDEDADSKAGILWQNDNGALALWEDPFFLNVPFAGTFLVFGTVAALPTVDPSWHVKGMADFSLDGREDVVFQNDNGAVVVWQMGGASGTTITAANLVNLNPGPAWHVVGLRDMNGDGSADILFQNDNGAATVWDQYQSLGGGSATFNLVGNIIPNPNPNGHVWDLL